MRKVKLIAEIEVEIGETDDDYCSEGDLTIGLRTFIEHYIEYESGHFTCKFRITKIVKEEL